MITHLLTRIDLMMNSLSKGQKRIALFIEEHYDKAAFMTANRLGKTVGVSESTVVRFAKLSESAKVLLYGLPPSSAMTATLSFKKQCRR